MFFISPIDLLKKTACKLYELGVGLPKNHAKAFSLYREALEQGLSVHPLCSLSHMMMHRRSSCRAECSVLSEAWCGYVTHTFLSPVIFLTKRIGVCIGVAPNVTQAALLYRKYYDRESLNLAQKSTKDHDYLRMDKHNLFKDIQFDMTHMLMRRNTQIGAAPGNTKPAKT